MKIEKIHDTEFFAHLNGECSEDCVFCQMEDAVEAEDIQAGKKRTLQRQEKAIKRY